MPFVKSLASKRCIYIVILILLLGEIMLTYLCYTKKGLVYIIIITSFSCQFFSYFKYTKLNIHLSYNIRLMSIDKYIYLTLYLYIL
jgi:hypothetical protein